MIGYPTHTECLTVITTKVLKLIAPLYQRPLVHLDHRIQKGREIGDGKDVLKTLICHTYMDGLNIPPTPKFIFGNPNLCLVFKPHLLNFDLVEQFDNFFNLKESIYS